MPTGTEVAPRLFSCKAREECSSNLAASGNTATTDTRTRAEDGDLAKVSADFLDPRDSDAEHSDDSIAAMRARSAVQSEGGACARQCRMTADLATNTRNATVSQYAMEPDPAQRIVVRRARCFW